MRAAVDARDEPVASALIAGAAIVDEIVAVSGQTVAAVLATLTRLEAAGLVVGRHGRYALAGALAAEPERRSAA